MKDGNSYAEVSTAPRRLMMTRPALSDADTYYDICGESHDG